MDWTPPDQKKKLFPAASQKVNPLGLPTPGLRTRTNNALNNLGPNVNAAIKSGVGKTNAVMDRWNRSVSPAAAGMKPFSDRKIAELSDIGQRAAAIPGRFASTLRRSTQPVPQLGLVLPDQITVDEQNQAGRPVKVDLQGRQLQSTDTPLPSQITKPQRSADWQAVQDQAMQRLLQRQNIQPTGTYLPRFVREKLAADQSGSLDMNYNKNSRLAAAYQDNLAQGMDPAEAEAAALKRTRSKKERELDAIDQANQTGKLNADSRAALAQAQIDTAIPATADMQRALGQQYVATAESTPSKEQGLTMKYQAAIRVQYSKMLAEAENAIDPEAARANAHAWYMNAIREKVADEVPANSGFLGIGASESVPAQYQLAPLPELNIGL
jgi:hypothetical protein